MSDTMEVWQLPDDLPNTERRYIKSVIKFWGGKRIMLRQVSAAIGPDWGTVTEAWIPVEGADDE